MLIVQKFGGSSLAGAERLRRAAAIIADCADAGNKIVAVVSARGDTTDELLGQARRISADAPARELDALLSCGETGSAAMTAMQLADMGKSCVSLTGAQAGILTDSAHGAARILSIDTARILRELGDGKIVVAAGFQGAEEGGDTTTLGRGGSDTTAVELAAALSADRCEIYSDVDGIYTADPRLVTGAVRLDRIDYGDMLRLALHGSQVLHSRSVEAAMRANVRVHLLSSFTRREGTVMCKLDDRPGLCGVTRDPSLGTVSVIGREANAQVLAEAVAALAHSDIIVTHTELFDGGCSLFVSPDRLLPALELVHRRFFR